MDIKQIDLTDQERKNLKRRTGFHITCNTNSSSKDQGDLLNETLTDVFKGFEQFLEPYILEDGEKVVIDMSMDDIIKDCTNAKVYRQLEKGGKFGRWHVHCYVSFDHNPQWKYHVNLNELRDYLREVFGYCINIRVDMMKDHQMDVMNYVYKNR